jgi:hypothetical protein
MTKTSSPAPSNPITKPNNALFCGCTSVRSTRTKLHRWYLKGIPRTDQLYYGRISAGYTSHIITLKTYKKDRDILDYKAMLEASAHCIIRGAIDAHALQSITANLSPYMKSPANWCASVQFSTQVYQQPISFKSSSLSNFGLSPGTSRNKVPFLTSWLQDIIRLSFPHFKYVSLFLIKNNRNSTKWTDDPVFHTDIPPGWQGDTSGIDERPEAPMVLWFPLETSAALDYKQHINKKNPPPKVTAPLLHLKPTDLLIFDRNTFLHRSSKPVHPNCSNFRVLIILSTNLQELVYK